MTRPRTMFSTALGSALARWIFSGRTATQTVEPSTVENIVRGRVKDVAYLGDMSVYLVEIDSGKMLRVTRPNVIRNLEDRIGPGELVFLSWHASSPVVLTQ